jgi:hypothetical protein
MNYNEYVELCRKAQEKKIVVIESPYAGSTNLATELNLQYLERCIADSCARNEAPTASHRIYPGALDDGSEQERAMGILCGYAFGLRAAQCDEVIVAFYMDRGMSRGMRQALAFWTHEASRNENLKIEFREIEE